MALLPALGHRESTDCPTLGRRHQSLILPIIPIDTHRQLIVLVAMVLELVHQVTNHQVRHHRTQVVPQVGTGTQQQRPQGEVHEHHTFQPLSLCPMPRVNITMSN